MTSLAPTPPIDPLKERTGEHVECPFVALTSTVTFRRASTVFGQSDEWDVDRENKRSSRSLTSGGSICTPAGLR
jgi:hypothetical protein